MGAVGLPVSLRTFAPGDVLHVAAAHGEIYLNEFSYDPVFLDYVRVGLDAFVDNFDGTRDQLWVAEIGGEAIGYVAIHHDFERPHWAKLRWYLVKAKARGGGAGRLLLNTAVEFARSCNYDGILLWTVDDLPAAARQYEAAGFRLVFTAKNPCSWAPWGREQKWELKL